MDLNQFGADLIKHLSRIANSLEAIESKAGKAAPAVAASSTAAVDKGVTKPAAAKAEKAEKAEKKETAKPKHTRDEMNAALVKVKDDLGKEYAAAIIKEVGGVAKMADIPDDKIDAVYDAAEAKHAEMVTETEEAGDL